MRNRGPLEREEQALLPQCLLQRVEAILECRARGLKEVRFESDSVQLIRAINLRSPNLEIYGIVEDIILMSAYFDVVVFVWIPRKRNCEADGIAKKALALYKQEVGEAELLPSPN